MKHWGLMLGLCWMSLLPAEEIERISLPTAANMQRADLYDVKEFRNVDAVLVLCPGVNGSGEGLIRQKAWQVFASDHRLGLVGLSFASDTSQKGEATYYRAAEGSGQILLDGVRKIYGKELPLFLYGFSGGAHFTSHFEEWRPDKVICWCAYSAGWWDVPQCAALSPPGIVACGDEDERYGASLTYFKQGRALSKPWLWMTVPKTGHSPSGLVENFIREYFDLIYRERQRGSRMPPGIWIDIDQGDIVDVSRYPTALTGWLPNKSLIEKWREICL